MRTTKIEKMGIIWEASGDWKEIKVFVQDMTRYHRCMGFGSKEPNEVEPSTDIRCRSERRSGVMRFLSIFFLFPIQLQKFWRRISLIGSFPQAARLL
jgi:hypothetical protein